MAFCLQISFKPELRSSAQMAFFFFSRPLTAPAKAPVFSTLVLSIPCFIRRPLRLHSICSISFSSSTLSANSISSTTTRPFFLSLRASPPQKYVYPDPIPQFAEAETKKFRRELLEKLSKDKDTFGDDIHTVVEVCTQILGDFLCKEYGGPGTLMVEPFTEMFVALKEMKLPGAPIAARLSLLWAQNYVDQDWEVWNSNQPE